MAGLTAQEIEQQVMGGAVGTVSTPSPIPFATDTTVDVGSMSAADIEEQMLSGQVPATSSGNTTPQTKHTQHAVSYTHLTLPTNREV